MDFKFWTKNKMYHLRNKMHHLRINDKEILESIHAWLHDSIIDATQKITCKF